MKFTMKQVLLWLGFLIAAVYAASINASYHFDDSHSVESNPAVRSIANIPSFWADGKTSSFIPENRVYRPLVYTFYSFCWAIGGGKTWPFHIMKMLMHWSVCIALFLIWRRLWSTPGWFPIKGLKLRLPLTSAQFTVDPSVAALLLAALFAVHPAGSECVVYIAATTSLQCAMFYVWAFYAYLLYRDGGNRKHLALALFLYFLSVASKEEGITLPAMVFITELFLNGKGSKTTAKEPAFSERLRGALRAAIPFAVLGVAMAAWVLSMRPPEGHESRGYVTSFQYFITQWRAYLWYMRLWFWPWDLNADTASMEFSKSIAEPLVIQAAIGNLLVLLIAWANRERYPSLLYGMLWFYVTIAPASSVVVLAEAINEHRMYLAYVGFVGGTFTVLLAMAEALFKSEDRPMKLGWIYAAIVAALVTGTQTRNQVWANDENLWLDTVEKNPTSGRALNNLALVYLGRGEYERAIGLLDKCEQHWTTYMYCPLNKSIGYGALGAAAEKAGKKDEAKRYSELSEKSLQRAYQLNPRNVHVNFHLGKLAEELHNDPESASRYYRAAIDLTGGRYPAAELRLGGAYARLKKLEEARAAFRRALEVEPNDEGLLFEKGRIEIQNGLTADATETYRTLSSRNPRHVQAWYNLGVAAVANADFQQARQAFQRTVELDPKSEQGWFNLAFVAEKSGDGKVAVDAVRKLVEISPEKQEYRSRLQYLENRFGK